MLAHAHEHLRAHTHAHASIHASMHAHARERTHTHALARTRGTYARLHTYACARRAVNDSAPACGNTRGGAAGGGEGRSSPRLRALVLGLVLVVVRAPPVHLACAVLLATATGRAALSLYLIRPSAGHSETKQTAHHWPRNARTCSGSGGAQEEATASHLATHHRVRLVVLAG